MLWLKKYGIPVALTAIIVGLVLWGVIPQLVSCR